MGHVLSCHCGTKGNSGLPASLLHDDNEMLFQAIKAGNVELVKRIVESKHPNCDSLRPVTCFIDQVRFHPKTTPLHVAALHGKRDVLALLLDLGADANLSSKWDGQTPLMAACKGGNSMCVELLLQHGADALAFESMKGRTCLHIACRQGHNDCVVKILEAARSGRISTTWGFSRYVNVRDHNGAIPLHMAARAGHAEIVRLLLNHGAMIMAVTCNTTYGRGYGSTPLHFAARSGSLNCVEELLAWGADRTRKDLMGCTPYLVAMNQGNMACAAILNPSAREPMVWPSPLKFMQDLEPETRSILQAALAQVNHARNSPTSQTKVPLCAKEKASKLLMVVCMGNWKRRTLKLYEDQSEDDAHQSSSPHLESTGGARITCCICFDSFHKMIQVDECGHQMCAACTMALCCLNKPKPHASSPSLSPCSPPPPSCPFCRRNIGRLTLAKMPSMKKLHHPDAVASVVGEASCEWDQLSLSNCCNNRCDSLRRSRSSSFKRQEAAF